MPQFRNRNNPDVITVSDDLVPMFEAKSEWERVLTDDEVAALKGEALDEALEQHGLPKSGKADEKRARLADDQKEN